jgi:hypothetical protein
MPSYPFLPVYSALKNKLDVKLADAVACLFHGFPKYIFILRDSALKVKLQPACAILILESAHREV